jgi:hypothetical protein
MALRFPILSAGKEAPPGGLSFRNENPEAPKPPAGGCAATKRRAAAGPLGPSVASYAAAASMRAMRKRTWTIIPA